MDRVPNRPDYLGGVLVGHRALVDRALRRRRRVDPGHRGLEIGEPELPSRLAARHDPAGSVGSRVVPIGIAEAGAQDASVPHVEGYDDLLSEVGLDRPLADDAVVYVDVIVDAFVVVELVIVVEPEESPEDLVHDALPVVVREFLAEQHVVEVVIHILPLEPAEILRDGLRRPLGPVALEEGLYLPLPSLGLQPLDLRSHERLVRRFDKVVYCFRLVYFGDLLAEVPRACVDDEVFISRFVLVDLDEVVAAAQRAERAADPVEVPQ